MEEKWWKKSVFYEIYMPSFKDGNGDGMGDFIGIISKLDYLKDLGIDGIWLTPFYPSPKADNGYDISDYYSIDPLYGTMDDFESFIAEAKKREIKVIADLVLNHTSSEHEWFKASKSSKENHKRDWYIWRDNPNNWESFFGGTAWEYDEETSQYYYHAFAKEQVDLNWSNSCVKEELFKVIEFWVDKGIDGFRLDVINFLKVSDNFIDNPYDEEKCEQIHQYDKDQEGILEVISEVAEFVHKFPGKFLVGEVGSVELDVLKQYSGQNMLDVVFNFNIGSIEKFSAQKIFQSISETEKNYSHDQIATLFFSSHDMSRYFSRFESDEIDAKLIATFMLTAKGVPFIYFGDEIGMKDWITDDISKMKDVRGLSAYAIAKDQGCSDEDALIKAISKTRDKSRTPMQWNSGTFAGFSATSPWITIPKDATKNNVEGQLEESSSMLNFYKRLISLRRESTSLQCGEYDLLEFDDEMFIYIRRDCNERLLVILNFSDRKKEIAISRFFEKEVELLLSSLREKVEIQDVVCILSKEAMILKEIKE